MKKYVFLLLVLLMATACKQQDAESKVAAPAPRVKMAVDEPRSFAAAQSLTEMSEPNASAGAPRKYIALRHHLQIEVPAKQMQAAFDATIQHCVALNCQMLSANYQRETPYSPPSANLSIRLPPRNVAVFLSGLAKSGDIMQHSREAEDKTNQVVDTDARIKNLTELRDRLRMMLADKSAKFRDVIDVERELANTQSQLDSFSSMRKILAQETELVAMNIDFVARQGITEQGFFAPVAQAVKNAGHVLMESLAAVITFLMSVIPWLLLGVPALLLLRKFWLRIKAK